MHEFFRKFSRKIAIAVGSPFAFAIAVAALIFWALTGPVFKFSDTWQLVINTATTIVTFLMVFLIQNTQNRDTKAMQIKLDELLRALKAARTSFVDIENLSDVELKTLGKEFKDLHEKAAQELAERGQKHE